MPTLSKHQYGAMVEALRRWTRFGKSDDPKAYWTGLGFETEYKAAVKAGLMVRDGHYGPRCMGWYNVTDKGAAVLRQWRALGIDYQAIESDTDNRLPPMTYTEPE